MLQVMRAARLPLVCTTRHQARVQRRISMAPAATLRVDLVQDLYLRELKNYKPAPSKSSDANGHVQAFSIPKPPPSPEVVEIADDLKAYEAQTVEVEGQTAEGEEEMDKIAEFFEAPIRQIDKEDMEDAEHRKHSKGA